MAQNHRHFVKDNFWSKRIELHRMTLDEQAKGGKWLVTACLVRSGGLEIRGRRQASSTSISGFARPRASRGRRRVAVQAQPFAPASKHYLRYNHSHKSMGLGYSRLMVGS